VIQVQIEVGQRSCERDAGQEFKNLTPFDARLPNLVGKSAYHDKRDSAILRAEAVAQLPKNATNDFGKFLFWLIVFGSLLAVVLVVVLIWYYRPTLEWVR